MSTGFGMRQKIWVGLGGLLGAAVLSMSAQAGTISIGLQETGVNGGAIHTVATGLGSAGVLGLTYGTFTTNNITATADGGVVFPDLLQSTSVNTSSSARRGLEGVCDRPR